MDENLENSIVDFVGQRDWVTFVELQEEFGNLINVKGNHTLECCKNGVLWAGMSKEFSDLIEGLIRKKRVFTHPASRLSYFLDGGTMKLPSPKNLPKDGMHVGWKSVV